MRERNIVMKNRFKVKSKSGFTLLEVILSVAILIVASSMILSGYLTAFNYSNDTGVFAKLSSRMYSNAVTDLSNKANVSDIKSRFATPGNQKVTVSCSVGTVQSAFDDDFSVIQWKHAAPSGGEASLNYDSSLEGSVVSANRATFMYSTKECPHCHGKQGMLRKYRDESTGQTNWFCWNPTKTNGKGCDYGW